VGPGFDFADFELLAALAEEADALRTRHPEMAYLI
jgi:predicted cupin superfamily sugar epimerase